MQYTLKAINHPASLASAIKQNENGSYKTYIVKDIKKSVIISIALLCTYGIVFFLLKNHSIIIPKISY